MTNKTETTDVTKMIAAEDEIWDADDTEKGRLLSISEQLGIVEMELKRPLVLSDREDNLTHLQVQAPSMDDIDKSQGNTIRPLLNKCVVGINPKDLGGMHGGDYLRLQRLVRHFLV